MVRLTNDLFDRRVNQTITRRTNRGSTPLSIAQRRVWLTSHSDGEVPACNHPTAIRLTGRLDVDALQRALDAIVARHNSLRTTFVVTEGALPVQSIDGCRRVDLPIVDVGDSPENSREENLHRALKEITELPFNLAEDFPLRATLLRLGCAEHVLLLVTHPIVSDRRSSEIFLQELAVLYRASVEGRPNPLPELPIQYADYAAWQAQRLNGEAAATDRSYWTAQLTNCPMLRLPSDRPAAEARTFRRTGHSFAFPATLCTQLENLSRNQGVPLFTTLLAAFKTLLYRYTGQEDFALAASIPDRALPELAGVIGNFDIAVMLRTDLSGDPTFRELLGRVSTVVAGASEHRNFPFDKMVDEIRPAGDLKPSPFLQTEFVFQTISTPVIDMAGLIVNPLEINHETTRFNLTLFILAGPDGLKGTLEYNPDLFEASTIERMSRHLRVLLEGIVIDPDRKISDLPIMTESEKHYLLVEWNDTRTEFPVDRCVHELFEQQVQRTPNATAVVCEGKRLSYYELNQRANQLAHYLRSLGVGPDTLVGICIERSLEMVIGLLGILKAGGAYLPLDPAYPLERLAFMLRDAQVAVLLTQEKLLKNVALSGPSSQHLLKCVALDRDWARIGRERAENPDSSARPTHVVYVIYTSGSTGTPKGVLIPHRALVNHNVAISRLFALGPQDRVAHFATLSFDIAVEEIFPTLISGATLVLHSPGLCFPDLDFLRWAEQEQITVLDLATGFWHAWVYALAASEKSLPANLRLLVVGGEQASAEAFTVWQGIAAEQVRWMNTYGPTEATVGTLFYEPGRENGAGGDSRKIPIGRPLANTQTYILDSHLQPVPIGVAGEIYLGGVCLARGYLNRPELTAARFIANPFSDEPGARLYRTGDLARHMPDGNIEFLGRVDNQLKYRGFRIELEEIETVLGQHPGVRDAVVLVREDTPDTQRLVAYIVPKQDFVSAKELVVRRDSDANSSTTEATMVARQMPTPSAAELRSFLRKKLPEYTVPTAFVMLGALPLTPNGKVDRRALPAPDQTRPDAEENFVAPRTPIEVLLAKIWANLFKLERVGAHDNFFDLGGHSLLAVRLMHQIERCFGKKLSLAALFQGPTIENLAKLVSQNVALPKWSFLVPLQPQGSKPPFFWVHGENSDAFLPRYLGAEQPLYGLRHQSEDGQPALYATVVDIAAHYCREICSVQSRGPYFLGGYCFGAVVAFEIAQQLKKQNHAVALLLLIEPDNPRIVEAPAQPRSGIRRQLRVGTSWLDEVSRHRQKLASLKANEKAHYIFVRAKGKTKEIAINIASPVQKFLQRTAYRAHLALGYPIPVSLRSRYILDIYARAMDEYAPKVYSDRLVIFKATDECEPDRWEKLAGGGIEMHEIHGDHTNILKEHHIRSWASLLKEQIDRAQSRAAPREDTPPVSLTESAPNAFVT